MSTIEIFAAETTGVRDEDEVIEWALGRYVVGEGLQKIDHRIVHPSGNLDWDPGAVGHHTKSGLLQEFLDGKGDTKIVIPFAACNLRLIWKKSFITPYLKGYGEVLAAARPADGALSLAGVLHGTRFQKPWRAIPKVKQIATALDLLSARA